MRAILLGVLFCTVGYSRAGDVATCSESINQNATITFTPYNDGIAGRYLAKWCTKLELYATSWELETRYDLESGNRCEDPSRSYKIGKLHSMYNDDISFDGNCSHVCLNTTVDLIFTSCYILTSNFLINNNKRKITTYVFNVKNDYFNVTIFNNTPRIEVHYIEKCTDDSWNVSIVWHTGVPFTYIEDTPQLWKKHNSSLDLSRQDLSRTEDIKVSGCSTPSETEVKCFARLTLGYYQSHLRLYAPWVHGLFNGQGLVAFNFSIGPSTLPKVEQARNEWIWALAGLVVTLSLAVAVYLVCRRRDSRAFQKQVLQGWLVHSRSTPGPTVVKPSRKYILLLYAREGPVAARFYAALKAMLEEASDTQVYDIFSPEVMSMAASGPAAWLRSMMQRNDVAILLLQTPAMAALYQHQLQDKDNSHTLQEPLLGRRVLYRAPQYGDTLLQYAITLTAEAVHHHSNYHKYYVATLSEHPTEMFPAVVPYRRYMLPAGAEALAQNMCDVSPSSSSVSALTAATLAFTDLATDNPNYLMDELMLV